MAEALGVAASAIQVADAGFKLYGALSKYVADFIDADKHARRLADEIRMTSWALRRLGTLLQEDDDIKLCKPEVIEETKAALHGCEIVFDEVESVLDGFSPSTSGPLVGMKRWKWPLKKDKALLLLAQFERLKTTLLLVFNVLSYASKLAAKTAQQDGSFLEERTQVPYLFKAKQEAIAAEQKLLNSQAPSVSKTATPLPTRGFDPVGIASTETVRGENDRSYYPGASLPGVQRSPQPGSDTFVVGAAFVSNSAEPLRHGDHNNSNESGRNSARGVPRPREEDRQRALIRHLDLCSAAIGRLDTAVEDARKELLKLGDMQVSKISRSLRETKRTFDDLIIAEHELDSETEPEGDDAGHPATIYAAAGQKSQSQRRSKPTPGAEPQQASTDGWRLAPSTVPLHASGPAPTRAESRNSKHGRESWLSRINFLGRRRAMAVNPDALARHSISHPDPRYEPMGAPSMSAVLQWAHEATLNLRDDMTAELPANGEHARTRSEELQHRQEELSEASILDQENDQDSDLDENIVDELLKKWTTVVA